MSSKRDKVESFIKREVRRAMEELAFNQPEDAATLRRLANAMTQYVAFNVASDPYRMRELQDIMDWKQPPKSK